SLIPTTKCRSWVSQSVSSRSYLEFRDLRERTRIILLHPIIFSSRLRIWYAGQIAKHTLRRVIKLTSIGKIGNAVNGLEIGVKCFVKLILGSKTYLLVKYLRWLRECGVHGLIHLWMHDQDETLVRLNTRSFG